MPDKEQREEQVKKGIEVEKEHKSTIDWLKQYVDDNGKFPPYEEIYQHIAENHVDEIPDYYDKLLKYVEASLRKHLVKCHSAIEKEKFNATVDELNKIPVIKEILIAGKNHPCVKAVNEMVEKKAFETKQAEIAEVRKKAKAKYDEYLLKREELAGKFNFKGSLAIENCWEDLLYLQNEDLAGINITPIMGDDYKYFNVTNYTPEQEVMIEEICKTYHLTFDLAKNEIGQKIETEDDFKFKGKSKFDEVFDEDVRKAKLPGKKFYDQLAFNMFVNYNEGMSKKEAVSQSLKDMKERFKYPEWFEKKYIVAFAKAFKQLKQDSPNDPKDWNIFKTERGYAVYMKGKDTTEGFAGDFSATEMEKLFEKGWETLVQEDVVNAKIEAQLSISTIDKNISSSIKELDDKCEKIRKKALGMKNDVSKVILMEYSTIKKEILRFNEKKNVIIEKMNRMEANYNIYKTGTENVEE